MGKKYRVKERRYLTWEEKYRVEEIEESPKYGLGAGMVFGSLVGFAGIALGIWMAFQPGYGFASWYVIGIGGVLIFSLCLMGWHPEPTERVRTAATILSSLIFGIFAAVAIILYLFAWI